MTSNAQELKRDLPFISGKSANFVAKFKGWGWHRTNNALKELGLK